MQKELQINHCVEKPQNLKLMGLIIVKMDSSVQFFIFPPALMELCNKSGPSFVSTVFVFSAIGRLTADMDSSVSAACEAP